MSQNWIGNYIHEAQWALPPSRAILWHINWNKLGILLSLSTININTQPVDWDVCGKVLRDLSLLYCTFSIPVLLLWTFSSGKNQFNLANLYSVPLFAIHLFYLSHTELRLTGYRCHPGLILRIHIAKSEERRNEWPAEYCAIRDGLISLDSAFTVLVTVRLQ